MRKSGFLRIELLLIAAADIAMGLVRLIVGVPLRWDSPTWGNDAYLWAWNREANRLRSAEQEAYHDTD